MILKKHLLAAICCLLLSNTFAQTARETATKHMVDSLKLEAYSEYAKRNSLLRQGFITTDIIGSSHIKAELNGKDLYAGNMNLTRVRANFNVPLAQWANNTVTGSVNYQRSDFETRDIQNFNPEFPAANRRLSKTTAGFMATYSRADSVFGHPVNISGGISDSRMSFLPLKELII